MKDNEWPVGSIVKLRKDYAERHGLNKDWVKWYLANSVKVEYQDPWGSVVGWNQKHGWLHATKDKFDLAMPDIFSDD